ncbi:MAG: shikimate dehydrogenase [Desulfitobacterium hafniense]|nr:shikimate dehydrogenase [Desulfitobacterium hafniense]
MENYFAVIGDPIAHSLSPLLHSAGYQSLGITAEYSRFRVTPSKLKEAVYGLRALGFSGWNVTIPHKESIIPLLDELTPEAENAGAVNTVKQLNGKLIGHNTDGNGFVLAIENKFNFSDKKAVILGAGGAARGIAFALKEKGMRIHILNRTLSRAQELASLIRLAGGEASSGDLLPGVWLKDVDLVVQTTPVGLYGENYPISLQGIKPKTLVVDIIYKPWETAFLREARKLGCQTINGLPMFLFQGVLAWEFWLGGKAPVEQMWAALVNEVQTK